MEGDGAEGKDIGHGIGPTGVEDGFGRQIDQHRFFGVLARVKSGAAGGCGAARGTRGEEPAGLPVEQAHLRTSRVRLHDQNALGAQGPMDDAVTVRVTNRVRDLAGKIQPDIEWKCRPTLAEEMVEPDLVGFAAEQDRRTEFVLLKVESVENAGVIEALQNLIFLERAPTDRIARCVV